MNQFQPSLTEWLEAAGSSERAQLFRAEDNGNRERLEVLYQLIGLPYERPAPLPAIEVKTLAPSFATILAERGDELCAIRLVPKRADLPKLRDRGRSIRHCYEDWFLKQDIPFEEYTAYICPHSETLEWSVIFVINEKGIMGEIVEGMHSQLTHGDTEHTVYQFQHDKVGWKWSEESAEAKRQVERMLAAIRVQDKAQQALLQETLQAEFVDEYLKGYFEATVWPGDKLYFIDYNRLLADQLSPSSAPSSPESSREIILQGTPTSAGIVRGPAVIVHEDTLASTSMPPNAILVCENTDVRYLPLMKQAAAFITDRGSLLSHASIVARELRKPCIVNTKNATNILKNGDMIEVDGTRGLVTREQNAE